MNSFVLLGFLLISYAYSQPEEPVAKSIPYTGVTSTSPPLFSASAGQVITRVSQITSFSFYVANFGSSNVAGSASIAEWGSSSVVATVNLALPSTTFSYQRVTASLNIINLDPFKQYVIYFTFPASSFSLYKVHTVPTANLTGGYVSRSDTTSSWESGCSQDVNFDLETTSTLSLHHTNFAEGHGASSWDCTFNTTYTAIQVDWQNMIINSGYYSGASSILLTGTCNPALYWVPFGTAAGCRWKNGYGKIDLRGTSYAVNESFVTGGYFDNGSVSFSSNNQVVDMRATGDCGFMTSETAVAADSGASYPGAASTYTGGFYIHLAKIN